jgi:NADPH:quinone reductase-like Zn-dependent oxidoreductase
VLQITGGVGVDITVEIGGAGTLDRSLKATRHGGRIGMLGALTGLKAEITVAMILMKRIRICGIMVDRRAAFEAMNRFIEDHDVRPVIDRRFPFEQLPEGLRLMESGGHFGKIVVTL